MSDFVVSARKYRPVNFDSVVGQPSVTNTLKNAIRTQQIAHAYLFCGPRGVGKTTCARIFAKTLNCFNRTTDTEACDQCESCKSFNESRSFNIHELDAASNNSVDDIRSLIEKVRILPQVGKYSIYIIDEVHMLSQAAFNAFLKTLEEPPEHAIFILATTEKHKIIPTILSRCQIFDFHRIRVEDIVAYLAKVATMEGIAFEEEALNVIALKADGAMRDALSIFDQVASFSNRNITYREVLENLNVLDYEYFFNITEVFLEGSATKALVIFNDILQRGFDGQNFLGGLSSHFRDLLVCHDEATLPLLEVSEVLKNRYRQQAVKCSSDFLFRALEICNQCELSYKASRNQRLHLEIALIRLCNIAGEKKNLKREQEVLQVPEISKQSAGSNPVSTRQESVPVAVDNNGPVTATVPKPALTKEPDNGRQSFHQISIKEALNAAGRKPEVNAVDIENEEDDNEEAGLDTDTPTKPLTSEMLHHYWSEYAAQLRESRPRMAVTLRSVEPVIAGEDAIQVDLNNGSQMDDFNNTTRSDLERYLQQSFGNNRITIAARLSEAPENQKVKLYTSEEKFRYLSQKNPALTTFRQKLNLELE